MPAGSAEEICSLHATPAKLDSKSRQCHWPTLWAGGLCQLVARLLLRSPWNYRTKAQDLDLAAAIWMQFTSIPYMCILYTRTWWLYSAGNWNPTPERWVHILCDVSAPLRGSDFSCQHCTTTTSRSTSHCSDHGDQGMNTCRLYYR